MAVSSRQSELFAGQSWTTIYRAFSQINFNASDPPSINAALRSYIQQNYPDEFSDWIEQSEFVAIIDLLSWLAGNLAFKTDISVRENFLDVAEARASILRLARFLSYNPSRCLPATGLVKITSITTDDDVYDSFGNNLNNVNVIWNNPNDPNWYEEFIAIMNNAFISTNQFGVPIINGTVQGIATQQYRLNGFYNGSQMSFSAEVAGTSMPFEICNGTFTDGGSFSEMTPNPTNAFNIYNLNDGAGNGSATTGFFMLFKQGTTGFQDFILTTPIANQILNVTSGNINQNDVWVQTITDTGSVLTQWTQIPIMVDSNITYNALSADQRNIYSVITQDNDQISIRFSDGLYGNAPYGNIRITYRVSNGLAYTINPSDIDSVQIPFHYYNPQGVKKTLYINFSLQTSVGNAATTENIEDIRQRATQVYATQNRMVNGEDYNSFPLQTNLARRIKAVNRIYSGQSRYIDLNDPTGTYQDLSLFEEDGIFFKEEANSYTEVPTILNYTPADMVSLFIAPIVASTEMANFVRDLYIQNLSNTTLTNVSWNQSTAISYNTTGWFSSTGTFSTLATQLLLPGTQILFQLPNNKTMWSSILEVFADVNSIPTGPTNGPVTLTNVVPTGATIISIIPRFLSAITPSTILTMINKIYNKLSFAITYDYLTGGGTWNVIPPVSSLGTPTLNNTTILLLTVDYLPGGGSSTGLWRIVGRGINYVFESVKSVEWYWNGARAIDQNTGDASTDSINILKINEDRNNPLGKALGIEYPLTIDKLWFYEDGTAEPRRTKVKFYDSYGYGYPDQPDTFYKVIDNTKNYNQYLFWYTNNGGVFAYPYDSTNTSISGTLIGYDTDTLMNTDTSRPIGTEAFIVTSSVSSLLNNTFWKYTTTTTGKSWVQDFSENWEYAIGRGPNVAGTWISNAVTNTPTGDEIAFHWKHYAPSNFRIDPSITNIHDIFVLTYTYDVAIRAWVAAGADPTTQPLPPSELELRLAFASMEKYKMFSDSIVWRPVSYKFLFGPTANITEQANFKVVRLPNATLSDGQIKSNVIAAINNYFDISFWDFGETFYFTELAAYVHQQLQGQIASIVIVPLNASGAFGNEFEIECNPDQIFISTATVANVQIISSNTPGNLRIR